MRENESASPLSFQSTEELIDFFDTNDMGDYWEQMPAVEFEVEIKRGRRLIPIEDDLMVRLLKIAPSQQMTIESLVNTFLRVEFISIT